MIRVGPFGRWLARRRWARTESRAIQDRLKRAAAESARFEADRVAYLRTVDPEHWSPVDRLLVTLNDPPGGEAAKCRKTE